MMRYRLICAVLALMLMLSALSGCGENDDSATPLQAALDTESATADESAPAVTEAEPVAETGARAGITAPKDLTELTAKAGTSPEALLKLGCSQVIAVRSDGSSASIDFYSLINNRAWKKKDDLSCGGYVGVNGVVPYEEMREGGMATPFGLWRIGEAFYINEKPATGLDSFQIVPGTYWVDDPNSAYYNKRVIGTDNMDWASAEDMYNIVPQYNYGFVFDFNSECIPGKGSAFFFHSAYEPTAGCIGTAEENVLRYLAELSADKNPCIIIV